MSGAERAMLKAIVVQAAACELALRFQRSALEAGRLADADNFADDAQAASSRALWWSQRVAALRAAA